MFWIPLITAGISALGTIIGAKKSADAATKAAQTQSTAVDRGIGAITQGYQQGQQALQPYAAGGLEAYNTMRTLSGLGLPTLATGGSGSSIMAPLTYPPPSIQPGKPMPVYQPGELDPMSQRYVRDDVGRIIEPTTLGSMQRPTFNQSSYVQMQAPDGSMNTVPAWDVPGLVRAGARVVA